MNILFLFLMVLILGCYKLDDPISDSPCELLNLNKQGELVVESYIHDNKFFQKKDSFYLSDIPVLDQTIIDKINLFLDKNLQKDFVSISVSNSKASVVYFDEESAEFLDLSDQIKKKFIKSKL